MKGKEDEKGRERMKEKSDGLGSGQANVAVWVLV